MNYVQLNFCFESPSIKELITKIIECKHEKIIEIDPKTTPKAKARGVAINKVM